MPERFTVLIADFLDETSIESAVLGDIAELVMARATDESELARHLPEADAIMLFHDLSILGEPSFARAPRCRGVVRAGVGYNNIDLEAATRHGVVVCNVPDYGTEEVADHAIMFLLALVRQAAAVARGDPRRDVGLPDRPGRPPAPRQDVRRRRLRPDRHRDGPPRQGAGARRRLLRPLPAPGDGQGPGHPPRLSSSTSCWSRATSSACTAISTRTTRHLINARTIARMRPGAILINTARGPDRRRGRAARCPRLGPDRRRRARRRRARAARQRTAAPAPQRPVHPAHGVLQRRGLHRAAHQDRRGSPPHPAGRAAAEPGECRGRSGLRVGSTSPREGAPGRSRGASAPRTATRPRPAIESPSRPRPRHRGVAAGRVRREDPMCGSAVRSRGADAPRLRPIAP